MARGRLISRSIGSSRKFAELHTKAGKLGEFAQTLYLLLIPNSDDFGRLAGDPFTVKHAVAPTSGRKEADFIRALTAMHTVGLIAWYDVDGQQVIEIQKFDEHQPNLHKRTASKFPGNSGKFPEIPPELNRTETNRTETKRTEGKGTETNRPAAEEPRARKPAMTGGVMAGTLPRDHLNCRQPCERICLSYKQFRLLCERHGGADAEPFVDGWAARVRANIPPGPFGGKPWEFWQTAWDRDFGGGTAVSHSRTAGNVAALQRVAQRGRP